MNDTKEPNMELQKFYLKDVSYEAPNSPEMFQSEWEPVVNIEIDASNRKLTDDIYEIVLKVTTSVSSKDKVAFLAEVEQAGIFTLSNFSTEQLDHVLNSYCPNVLFPYAREAVSDLTTKGGFMPLLLAPVNFDALYAEKKQQAATSEGEQKH